MDLSAHIKKALFALIFAWAVLAAADQLLPSGEREGQVGGAAKKVILLSLLCYAAQAVFGR